VILVDSDMVVHSLFEFSVHSLLFAVVAYILFRPQASAYFRGATAKN
jgi:hypothetical protein